ncbi:hypothetical protein GOPIP_031_01840 [Gordonia polyisoprenivorans NBRC 16320 = JCM 10675]|nr:hypothetical protein GOPIP_031_01840 [Gordonia polyisoprenivorans NBRC 16320 = JCM 10675]
MTTWRYDRGDKRAVAGAAEMIVIGRVLAQIDAVPQQLGRRSIPRTQFSVEVIRCLKGDRTGRMVVSQMGGRSPDGSLHVFDKDRLLRVGHVHLLAGRYSEPDGWYALIARAGTRYLGGDPDSAALDSVTAEWREPIANPTPLRRRTKGPDAPKESPE